MFRAILSAHVVIISFLFSAGCSHSPARSESVNRGPSQLHAGTVTIADPSIYSQVYAISDVHGMYDGLLEILKIGGVVDSNGNWAAGRALLVITGDSIDKGTKSIEVIDLWVRLQQQADLVGGRVMHTLGNHEAEFLANPSATDLKAAELIAEMQALRIPLSDLTSSTTVRGRFLHSEPVALRVGGWLFCHSGFYPEMTWDEFSTKADKVLESESYADDFLIGTDSILEAKKWELDLPTVSSLLGRLKIQGIYGVVFGHQPGAFGIHGRSAAKAGGRLIKIDNGMAPEAGAHPGSLLIFTSPKQMTELSYPSIKVISRDGSQRILVPE